MSKHRVVRFYLHKTLRARAEAGGHNFITKMRRVLEAAGMEVRFHGSSEAEILRSRTRPGHAVFLMTEPTTARGVSIRLNYYYPFWNIERTAARWEWPVAQAHFDPAAVPATEAARFARFWRGKLFGEPARQVARAGFVYVPLQGRLLTHRSFQACSPLAMLEALLAHDPGRPIIATLHPKEDYSAQERHALGALVERHDRLSLRTGDMAALLQGCDYVATQNSSVALAGYFFSKPAVLFGRINFHHIAANVHALGIGEAVRQVPELRPDYDAYLWWFLQKMSINAGRDEAEAQIADALRRFDWPV